MASNRYGDMLFRMTSLLSQRVAQKDPFFKEIALMDIENRRRLSLLYVLINDVKLFEKNIEDMNEKELIEKIVYKFIQRFGQASFRADPLTHLGFKLGVSTDSRDWNESE